MIRRPRLFTRLFLAFLLAMLLAGAGYTLVTFASGNDPLLARWYTDHSGAVRLCARLTATRFEQGGRPAATAFLQEMETATGLQLTLTDAGGVPLAGRPLTSTVQQRTAEALKRNGGMDGLPVKDPVHLSSTFPLSGAQGTCYALVAQLPGGLLTNLIAPAARTVMLLLAAGGVCYALARSVTAPILSLRQTTRRLAGGDLSARTLHSSPALERRGDEIGDLCRDFDRMAERLEAVLDGQKRLLADISHELRSPLARLVVALELTRRRAEGNGEADLAPSLDRIEREAERMNGLIGELLTLSRLEAGAPGELITSPYAAPIDLNRLVCDIAADADYEAQARGCRCLPLVPPEALFVQGDAEYLQRAIENVVRNAVRYTAPNTAVEVTLSQEGADTATITVRDHGPGVAEAHLADLFRAFWREAEARDRATGGIGLGLAIAERAVRLHGGGLSAENVPEGEGGGLQMTMTLPLAIEQQT